MKKFLSIALATLLVICSIPSAAYALEPIAGTNNEVYYEQNAEPARMRTRGTCSEVYSRAWCNAHGYGNNRPVPARVNLTSREKRCIISIYGSLTKALIAGIVSGGSGSVYTAAADFAFVMWMCAA